MSGINGTSPIPRNIKAQQLRTKVLLQEVLSREIKIEGGPVWDAEVSRVKEEVGWGMRWHRLLRSLKES